MLEVAAPHTPLPNLTMLKLRVFREVVERESLTAAARALFITQPVVSGHIANLEAALGVALLRRQGRRMLPTEAGQELFNYACAALDATQRMVDQVGHYRMAKMGRVSLATDRTSTIERVSALAIGFLRAHERAELVLHVADHLEIESAVLNGLFDFGYVLRHVGAEGPAEPAAAIEFEALAHDELIAVVHHAHHWASRSSITLAELTEELWVAGEPGSARRAWEHHWLEGRGLQLPGRLWTGHPDVRKQAVLAGFGAHLLYQSWVAPELAQGMVVELAIEQVPWPPAERGIIYRKGMRLTPLQEVFLNYCRTALARHPL